MNFICERINQMLSALRPFIYKEAVECGGFEVSECGYKDGEAPPPDAVWRTWEKSDRFGGREEWHGWFRGRVEIPSRMRGESVELENCYHDGRNPQYLVYLDGKLVKGTDTNHRLVPLDSTRDGYDVTMYVYTGYDTAEYRFEPRLVVYDRDIEGLYYDIKVPYDALSVMEADSREQMLVREYLNNALNLLDWQKPGSPEFYASAVSAREYLKREFYDGYCKARRDGSHAEVVSIGHTHIDVAWLWTFAQTREKTQRSFSTVVSMMKKYPEYKFMSSQAQLYKYLKEDSPQTYDEVRRLISEGRWEVEGAMWIEADCNLTGGESLVRQILYGKRFFREEFGVESHVLWLPDVFGYSAALPQILRKSGVDKFVTSKISWNETNMMPYDIFDWQGIDGTSVFSYFLTAQNKPDHGKNTGTTYNSTITPRMIAGTWNRMQQKELTNEVLNTFGYGDGGGGPTDEMLENGRRLAYGIGDLPKVKYEFAGSFLDRLEGKTRATGRLPKWVGELYLEYHRGTYTSNAKNKKNNRRCEFLYTNAEALSVTDMVLFGGEYPKEALLYGWERIMLCQFHDVLPGSSIKPVYDDTDVIYADIAKRGEAICRGVCERIAANTAPRGGDILVFNQNSFKASGTVTYNGETVYVKDIPPRGYKLTSFLRGHDGAGADIEKRILENEYIRVSFAEDWSILSIYDKSARREALAGAGNRIVAYEDFPRAYDAWEITNYYKEKANPVNDVSGVALIDMGAEIGFEITRRYLDSVIIQAVTITPYDKKIDFKTKIDWHNRHILLKTHFAAAINADTAVYEIQYGHVSRPTHENTSWDAAKFEVCAHKFADISEHGYGFAIINDCKYGHSCSGSELSLTLLKSATHPNPEADQGVHEFTYSVIPHERDFRDAGVISAAYLLNNPLAAAAPKGAGECAAPIEYSLISSDRENIMIEAIKRAEDGDAVIVRLYDAYNMRSTVKITAGFDFKGAYLADMEERDIAVLSHDGRSIELEVAPFEIVTLKLYI